MLISTGSPAAPRHLIAAALVSLGPLLAGSGGEGWAGEARAGCKGIDGPLSPEKALAAFQVEPGLRLELVAAEPLIASPVAWRSTSAVGYSSLKTAAIPRAQTPASLRWAGSRCWRIPTVMGRMDRRSRIRRGAHVPQRRHALEGRADRDVPPDVSPLARYRQ